jgi:hypothetical protein
MCRDLNGPIFLHVNILSLLQMVIMGELHSSLWNEIKNLDYIQKFLEQNKN